MLVLFVLLLLGQSESSDPGCDSSRRVLDSEGNHGQTGTFPWLGVLRVHLHYEKSFKVAITGIVLFKTGYALASAHDVARIPKRTFMEESEAMFIPREQEPWHCRLKDYFTHPEYEYSTVNTIAILELDPGEDRYYPMRPICWPPRSYNTTRNLYAVGFTDDNMLLEKSIYRLKAIDLDLCKEFYTRAGLTEGLMAPVYYSCVSALNNRNNCIWDNGMILVSNTSQYWTLLGFGVHGPGCGAPARFLDLAEYLPWVESATDVPEEIDARRDMWSGRRIHDMLSTIGEEHPPPFGADTGQHYPFLTDDEDVMDFNVTRMNQSAIFLQRLDDRNNNTGRIEYGQCNQYYKKMIYHDEVTIDYKSSHSGKMNNNMVYKISLYNLRVMNYSCIKLYVESPYPEEAYLFYKTKIEVKHAYLDTPPEILRYHPIRDTEREIRENLTSPAFDVHRPHVISSLWSTIENVTNVNVYVIVKFRLKAKLVLMVFGNYGRRVIHTTRARVRRRRSTSPTTTLDPYVGRRRGAPHSRPDLTNNLPSNKEYLRSNSASTQYVSRFILLAYTILYW